MISHLNIKKDEYRPTLYGFLYSFLIVSFFILSKSFRDSLFLNNFSKEDLSYLYLVTPIITGFLVWLFGLTGVPKGAPVLFMIANGLALVRCPRQAIADGIPLCPGRKWLNQNEFRARLVATMQRLVKVARVSVRRRRHFMPFFRIPVGRWWLK